MLPEIVFYFTSWINIWAKTIHIELGWKKAKCRDFYFYNCYFLIWDSMKRKLVLTIVRWHWLTDTHCVELSTISVLVLVGNAILWTRMPVALVLHMLKNWATPRVAQGWLLALHLGITAGRAWGTIYGTKEWTQVSCVWDNFPPCYNIVLVLSPTFLRPTWEKGWARFCWL